MCHSDFPHSSHYLQLHAGDCLSLLLIVTEGSLFPCMGTLSYLVNTSNAVGGGFLAIVSTHQNTFHPIIHPFTDINQRQNSSQLRLRIVGARYCSCRAASVGHAPGAQSSAHSLPNLAALPLVQNLASSSLIG